jgi:hypothetical protein
MEQSMYLVSFVGRLTQERADPNELHHFLVCHATPGGAESVVRGRYVVQGAVSVFSTPVVPDATGWIEFEWLFPRTWLLSYAATGTELEDFKATAERMCPQLEDSQDRWAVYTDVAYPKQAKPLTLCLQVGPLCTDAEAPELLPIRWFRYLRLVGHINNTTGKFEACETHHAGLLRKPSEEAEVADAIRRAMKHMVGDPVRTHVVTAEQMEEIEQLLAVHPFKRIVIDPRPLEYIRMTFAIGPEGVVTVPQPQEPTEPRALTYVSFASTGDNQRCLGVVILEGEVDVITASVQTYAQGINPGGEVLAVSCRDTDKDVPDDIFEAMWANRNRLIPSEEARVLFDARSLRELDAERAAQAQADAWAEEVAADPVNNGGTNDE